MKTALVIMGHKSVEETINRHWPYWVRWGMEVLGTSPQDGTMWPDGIESMAFGVNAHCGFESAKRLTNIFQWLSGMSHFDKFLMIEYDCIILNDPRNVIEESGHFAAHFDVNKEGTRFKSDIYFPPPWIFTREAARDIFEQAQRLLARGDIEEGFSDRFLARIIGTTENRFRHVSGVQHGYFDLDQNAKKKAKASVEAGDCLFLHCIKTPEDLEYFDCKNAVGTMAQEYDSLAGG